LDNLQNVFEYGEKKGVSKVYTPGGLPEVELMDRLTVFNHDGRLVIDSREVAAMVGKRHDNLLRDIQGYVEILVSSNLRAQEFFIYHAYIDTQGKERPCFLLTRKGCEMVANKMTGEKGVLFTAAYVTKFEEMERQLNQPQFKIPQTYPEALRALADEVEKREAVEAEKQKLLPKAESYDSLMSTDGLFSMSNTAKILNYQGAGPQNIFKVLAVEDIFFKRGDRYSVYQEYIRRGYFQEKATTYRHGDRIEAYKQIFATPKGLDWLDRFLAERGYEKNTRKEERA